MINSLLPETPKLAHKKCATWSSSRPAWPAEHMVTYFHFEALPVKKFSHLQRKVKKKNVTVFASGIFKAKKRRKKMAVIQFQFAFLKIFGCSER